NSFAVAHTHEAWVLIMKWLRCDGFRNDQPECPHDRLPSWAIDRLTSEWRRQAVETRGRFFESLLNAGAPNFVLNLAAQVSFAFYRNNLDALNEAILSMLWPFLR